MKLRYEAPFAVAMTSASSIVGPLIPFPTPMIVVGMLATISIGELFLVGAILESILGSSLILITYVIFVKK